MDKYQANLLSKGTITFRSEKGEEKIVTGEKLIVYQNENYKIGGYQIVFTNPSIVAVTYNSKKYTSKKNVVVVDYDFAKSKSELVISFKNELADDCLMHVSAVLADKAAFDAKVEEQNQAELVAETSLLVKSGPALLNVFWKRANRSVNKCIVKVRFKNETGIEYRVFNKEVEGEFISVSGLAYGKYVVTLEEYFGEKLVVSTEASVNLTDVGENLKKELEEVKELLKGVRHAAIGHCVTI